MLIEFYKTFVLFKDVGKFKEGWLYKEWVGKRFLFVPPYVLTWTVLVVLYLRVI